MISSSPRILVALDSSPIVVSGSSILAAMARISFPSVSRLAAFQDRSAASFLARNAADSSGSLASRTRHLRSVLSSIPARFEAVRSPDTAASSRTLIASSRSISGLAMVSPSERAGSGSPPLLR